MYALLNEYLRRKKLLISINVSRKEKESTSYTVFPCVHRKHWHEYTKVGLTYTIKSWHT